MVLAHTLTLFTAVTFYMPCSYTVYISLIISPAAAKAMIRREKIYAPAVKRYPVVNTSSP